MLLPNTLSRVSACVDVGGSTACRPEAVDVLIVAAFIVMAVWLCRRAITIKYDLEGTRDDARVGAAALALGRQARLRR